MSSSRITLPTLSLHYTRMAGSLSLTKMILSVKYYTILSLLGSWMEMARRSSINISSAWMRSSTFTHHRTLGLLSTFSSSQINYTLRTIWQIPALLPILRI